VIEPNLTVYSFGIVRLELTQKVDVRSRGNLQIFTAFSLASLTSPSGVFSGGHMEAVYFIGAFVLLVALIYGTLNWHYRDRRKDRMTDQIVRDRYEHNRT
jgi:hypothetical protein